MTSKNAPTRGVFRTSFESLGGSPRPGDFCFYQLQCYDTDVEKEYEAKFLNINKGIVRQRLRSAGATLERPEFLQRRWVLDLPNDHNTHDAFVRVRDEGGIVTLTWKDYPGGDTDSPDAGIHHPYEIEVGVTHFDKTVEMLTKIGCVARSYQENYRELWHLYDAKITIDSWPFIEPLVEVEARDEKAVEVASTRAGFDWSTAQFSGVNRVYKMKYGDHVQIRHLPKLTFEMPNPF